MAKAKHAETYKPQKVPGGHAQMVGYARVSTSEQDLGLGSQQHELKKAGCSLIYSETASGGTSAQPILAQCVEHLRKGDTLVVVRLDRLSRRLQKLIVLMDDLQEQGVFVRSITQGLNTRQRNQRDALNILAVLAETERNMIRERTREGLAEAARRGRRGGYPVRLTPAVLEMIAHLKAQKHSNRAIAKACKISETSVRVALTRLAETVESKQMKLVGVSL